MTSVSGPYFDGIVKEVVEWYLTTKEFLIKALTEDYPYGSVKLTPEEQLENFLTMNQQDWQALSDRLALRHRGHPDAEARVEQDLQDFVRYMEGLRRRLGRG